MADKETNVKAKPSLWKGLPGINPPTVIRQFDGVNKMNPYAVKDGYATSMKNLTVDKYPSLTTRIGSRKIENMPWSDSFPIDGLYFYGQNELHVFHNSYWFVYKLITDNWTMLLQDANMSGKRDFTTFNVSDTEKYLIATGPGTITRKYDGTSVTPLANAPSEIVSMTSHDNRLYGAKKNTVYYSALRKPEDWSTVNDSGSIVVETANSDMINKLVAAQGRLTIFKANSIHELFGTSPSNFQLKSVTDDLGSPYPNSIQTIDGVIYFVSSKAIYRYSGGVPPKNDFSLQVNKYIEEIPFESKQDVYSWVNGRRYYVSLPLTNGNTILEYDVNFGTWTVWSLPNNISCNPITFSNAVFYGDMMSNVCEFVENGDFTDYGNPIKWEWISKPFTVSSIAQKVTWYKMWLVADIAANSTMNVSVSTSGEDDDWTLVQEIVPETDITAAEIIIPHNLLYNQKTVRLKLAGTGQITLYEVSRQERAYAFGMQGG